MSIILEMARKRAVPLRSVVVTLTLTMIAAAALLLVMGSASGVQGRVLDSGPATVYVDPDAQSVSRCGAFTVAVAVRDLPDSLAGYQFTMGFSPDVLTVTNVVDKRFNGGAFPWPPRIEEDSVTFFAFTTVTGTVADGPLAVVELEPVGLGPSDLVLSQVKLSTSDAEPILSTLEHGTVEAVKEASELSFEIVADQVAGSPFNVTLTAVDEDGARAAAFDGTVDLSDSTGTLTPTGIALEDGAAVFSATVTGAATDVTLAAAGTNACGAVITGTSAAFDVAANVAYDLALEADPIELTVGATSTLTATVRDAYGNPVADDTLVVFETDLGALGSDVITRTTTGGLATAALTSDVAGTATVTATAGAASDAVEVLFTLASAVSVHLTPDAATVTAGESVTYTLTAADDLGNTWDVTAEAEFAIEDDAGGAFDANVYTSEVAGLWTVTGSWEVLTATAALTVEADEEYPVSVTIAPDPETVTAGESVTYTLTAKDQFGNPWDVTGEADFAIDEDAGGAFDANVYTSEIAGLWTVTGSYLGLSDAATLTVEQRKLDRITVSPSAVVLRPGQTQPFTATCFDAFDNEITCTPIWSVAAADAGTIGSATGLFTAGTKPGTYPGAVVATVDSLTGTADVTVRPFQIFMPLVARDHAP